MAEKKFDAPFETTDIQIGDEIPLDSATLFKSDIDGEYETLLNENFSGKLDDKKLFASLEIFFQ